MAARLPKFSLTTLLALLTAGATPSIAHFPTPFSTTQASAQTQLRLIKQQDSGIRFVPPDLVAPNQREGGAIRGGCQTAGALKLTALIPEKTISLTVSNAPTFFVYLPRSPVAQERTAEFFLEDENNNIVYKSTIPISGNAGIVSFSLPGTKTLLEVGRNYHWSFSLICAPEDRASDLLVDGMIRQVELDSTLKRKLETATLQERVVLYAAAGIWHETLTTLAELRRSNPQDVKLTADWVKVLESVGLGIIAKEPFATEAIAQIQDARQITAAQLFQQGSEQYRTSQFKMALSSWQQALALFREISDQEFEGKTLSNLGLVYYSLGEYTKAIEFFQQSLVVAQKNQDQQTTGRTTGNLGLTYEAVGNLKLAVNYYQQSLAIVREIKDLYGEAQVLGNLGSAYFALENYAQAIQFQQQRLAITRTIKERQGEAAALNQLGLCHYTTGKLTQAIEFYQQSLNIVRDIQDRRGEGQVLGNLGLSYLGLGNVGQATEVLQQSLSIVKSIQDRPGEGLALNNLGFAFLRQGKLTESIAMLSAGIEVWESVREDLGNNDAYKVSIFEEQVRTYRLLQQALIAQKNPNAALEIAERGRARAFVELLARRLAVNSSAEKLRINPPTIEQIKQIAKIKNSTLVEYSLVSDTDLYIWVIKPTGEVTFRTADFKSSYSSIENLVSSSRESLGVRGRGLDVVAKVDGTRQTEQLQQLYQLLIEPITDQLPTDPNAHVIFIPQQDIFFVPFPALKDSAGQYLIEKHTILTAPSIQVLVLNRQQQRRGAGSAKTMLIVGNPTMPSVAPAIGERSRQLPPLKGAEQEALEIAQLMNSKALIGDAATESAVVRQLPQAGIIHLATHGLLDDFQGLGVPGAIALAPTGGDDGLLTAGEILNLQLSAELVVLSACDTAQGTLTGDGVIGLSRALITAGASSVIVSLWSIPDAPTASLMTEFYRYFQMKPDKAQALRQAMLKTMKQYPNQPSNWAAFTLIGEAE